MFEITWSQQVISLASDVPFLLPFGDDGNPINPLVAKFFWGNINIYLHYISFLHNDSTQELKTLSQVREGPLYSI